MIRWVASLGVQATFLGTEARFALVTLASHRRRAVQQCERAGLAPIAAPTGFKTGPDPRATGSDLAFCLVDAKCRVA